MYNMKTYCYTCINSGKARMDPEFDKDGRGRTMSGSRPKITGKRIDRILRKEVE